MRTCYQCFQEYEGEFCPYCGYDPRQDRQNYPLALAPGTVLAGRYIIGRVLGEGGFGVTYLAQDYHDKTIVAIKEYFPDSLAARTGGAALTPFTGEREEAFLYGKACFLKEAQTLAQFIGVEGVVRVYSYFEENGTAYFAMEYVRGESLLSFLNKQGGTISFEECRRIFYPVINALEAIHEKGIIHRDIAPDNIILTDRGDVRLIDFGAARYSLGDRSRSLDVVLKHGYAPKEQYNRHGRQGPFTDIYALCATIYKCLTGRTPPDALDRLDEDTLEPPSALGAAISPSAEQALLKGLAVQHTDRYQNIKEFKEAFFAGDPAPVNPVSIDTPTRAPEHPAPTVPVRDEKPEPEITAPAKEARPSEDDAMWEPVKEAFLPDEEQKANSRMIFRTDADTEKKPKIKKKAAIIIFAVILLPVMIFFSIAIWNSLGESLKAPSVGSVDVTAGGMHTVGLKSNQTVVAEGLNVSNQCNVDDWTDIVAISAGYTHTVGLKKDGTVIVAGPANKKFTDLTDWKDIVAISAGDNITVGLKKDGTAIAAGVNDFGQCDVNDWKHIIAISAGESHTVGLHKDGTVVAAGSGFEGQCEVGKWKDIVAVAAGGNHTVGLKKDGTVVAIGRNNEGQCKVSEWKDIVSIAAGYDFTVGLTTSGRVVAVGNNDYEQLNVNGWTSIIAISAGYHHTVGLREFGGVEAAGCDTSGQCSVSEWDLK